MDKCSDRAYIGIVTVDLGGRSSMNGNRKPPVRLIVEARSMASHDSSSWVKSHEVHRPASIGRQRDQLVRAALRHHPEARLASVEDGMATLFSHTHMIVASYGEVSRTRAKERFLSARASVQIPV